MLRPPAHLFDDIAHPELICFTTYACNTNTQNNKSKITEGGECDWNARSLELESEITRDTLHVYPFLLTGQSDIPTHLVKIGTRVWKRKSHDFLF